MSVRAYRLIRVEHEKEATFNLWHDEELMKFLEARHDCDGQLGENGGTIDLPIEALEEAIKTLKLDAALVAALRRDIEAVRADGLGDDDCISYYCF